MMPSCDQIGVPLHFHSSTTSRSASLMSLRILLRVSPRQSPSSAILFEMSSDAGWPWLAPDFFMFSSLKFQMYFVGKTAEDRHVSLLKIWRESFPDLPASPPAPGELRWQVDLNLWSCLGESVSFSASDAGRRPRSSSDQSHPCPPALP